MQSHAGHCCGWLRACLVDGNKRLAWTATKAFCAINGFWLQMTDVDAEEDLVLDVAEGKLDVVGAAEVTALHPEAIKPYPPGVSTTKLHGSAVFQAH